MSEEVKDLENAPSLSSVGQKFVLHWGEMGSRWGINRTVAQIHALLYLSPRPLHAEEISQTLKVARSNVSTSLRELQSFGVVKVTHVLGDRRDHFESVKDVWEMFQIILDERKRREIDPTLKAMRECVEELGNDPKSDPYTHERISSMLELMENMSDLYEELRRLPRRTVLRLTALRGRLKRWLEGAR